MNLKDLLKRKPRAGKIPQFRTAIFGNLFESAKLSEISYEENDIDLFRAIYHNTVIAGKGSQYKIAAALGKPVINIAASYSVGRGFKISLDNPDNDIRIIEAEKHINTWIEDNARTWFNIARHAFRDGDAYLHIDEFGKLTEYDAKGVEEILDPISGKTVGFDIRNRVEIQEPGKDRTTTYIYLKKYRTDSLGIYRYKESSPKSIETIWERVFTTDGLKPVTLDKNGNRLGVNSNELAERNLSVVAYHNEPEPDSVYGNSDFLNLLPVLKEYSELLSKGITGGKYNAVPIPVISGNINPTQSANEYGDISTTAKQIDEETQMLYGGNINMATTKTIYLGQGGSASFISGNGFMGDIGKLMEYLFYLFVQGSETPEFILGTAVSSSKASTDSQAPIFDKKIERKQLEFSEFIIKTVETLIEKRALMSDSLFQHVKQLSPKVTVIFPPLDEDDKKMLFETVQWAYENGLMTSETALNLILSDQILDVPAEIRKAAQEQSKKTEQSSSSQDRLVRELLSGSNNGSQSLQNEKTPNNSQNQEKANTEATNGSNEVKEMVDVVGEARGYNTNRKANGQFAKKGTGDLTNGREQKIPDNDTLAEYKKSINDTFQRYSEAKKQVIERYKKEGKDPYRFDEELKTKVASHEVEKEAEKIVKEHNAKIAKKYGIPEEGYYVNKYGEPVYVSGAVMQSRYREDVYSMEMTHISERRGRDSMEAMAGEKLTRISREDAINFLKEGETLGGLSSQDERVLNMYSLVPGQNGAARKGEKSKAVDSLQEIINRTKAVETETYRGITGDFAQKIKNLKVGETFTDKGFQSTSYDKDVAKTFAGEKGVMLNIKTKGGLGKGIDIYSDRYNESEYLLAMNSTMKVVKKKGNEIWLEQQ